MVLTLEWYCVPVYQARDANPTKLWLVLKFLMPEAILLCKRGYDIGGIVCQCTKSGTLTQPSYRHKH